MYFASQNGHYCIRREILSLQVVIVITHIVMLARTLMQCHFSMYGLIHNRDCCTSYFLGSLQNSVISFSYDKFKCVLRLIKSYEEKNLSRRVLNMFKTLSSYGTFVIDVTCNQRTLTLPRLLIWHRDTLIMIRVTREENGINKGS